MKIINNLIILFLCFYTKLSMAVVDPTKPETHFNPILLGPSAPGGYSQFSNQVGLDGVEHIRLSNGNVTLLHKDISLPVSKDLSIDINRYYSSPEGIPYSTNYYGGKSILGIGWDMHMGRILNVKVAKHYGGCSYKDYSKVITNYILELPDGARKVLYNSEKFKDFTYITKDMWMAECTTNGMVVYVPDGRKMFFEEYSSVKEGEGPALSLTKMEDKFGNYYTVTYKNLSIWDDANTGESYTLRSVDQVIAQDGRTINFVYNGRGLESIYYNNRIWNYTLESEIISMYSADSYLINVTGPEGIQWNYDYNKSSNTNTSSGEEGAYIYTVPGMFSIKSITTPYGARVEYEYVLLEGGDIYGNSNRLSKRILFPSDNQQSSIWTYKYTYDAVVYDEVESKYVWKPKDPVFEVYAYDLAGKNVTDPDDRLELNFTLVEGPSDKQLYQYCRTYILSTDSSVRKCLSLAGQEIRNRIYDKSDNLLQETHKSWLHSREYTNDQHLAYIDSILFSRVIQESVKRGDDYYNTVYQDFDEYLNPILISEFDGLPLTETQIQAVPLVIATVSERNYRQKQIEYFNNPEPALWQVGWIKSENLPDFADSNGQYRVPDVVNNYDVLGKLTSTKNYNNETFYTYYANGDLETTKDPMNKITRYSQYKYGIPEMETYEEGVSVSRVVDVNGNITSFTNGRGFRYEYQYDGINRLKIVRTPKVGDDDVVYSYDWAIRKIKKQRGLYIEEIKVDGLGRELETNIAGTITKTSYDADGRVVFKTDPGSVYGTEFNYDALGRMTQSLHTSDNTFVMVEYLPGNKTRVTNQEQKVTEYTYSAYSHPDDKQLVLIEQKPKLGSGSIFTNILRTYRGDILRVNQGNVNVESSCDVPNPSVSTRCYLYDENYYLHATDFPENGITEMPVNGVGNIVTKQVATNSLNPSPITQYIYDNLHRLKTIDFDGLDDIGYVYDNNNNITQVTRGTVVTDYVYDENDNLESETLTIDGYSYTLAYDYNSMDALSSLTYPGGLFVDYLPNNKGQPTKAGTFVNNIQYHPNGQISQLTYANGKSLVLGQNNKQYVDSIVSNNNVSLSYVYGKSGNVDSITDNIDPTYNLILGYDDFDRLSTADGIWGTGVIEYNSLGDITRKQIGTEELIYTYDPGTSLLGSISGLRGTTKDFYYDAYRNMSGNGIGSFTYDEDSNLIRVDNMGISYQYDGNKYRVLTTDNGYKRYSQYASDGQMYYEYDPQKRVQSNYIRVGRMMLARHDNFESCDTVTDTDLDGVNDCVEYRNGTDIKFPDSDGDNISDADELIYNLNPLLADTDGDGMPDDFEIFNSLNPRVNDATGDIDGDGVLNIDEYLQGTSVSTPNTVQPSGDLKFSKTLLPGDTISNIVINQLNEVFYVKNSTHLVKMNSDGVDVWSMPVIVNSVQQAVTDDPAINIDGDIYLSAGSHILKVSRVDGAIEIIFDLASVSPTAQVLYKPTIRTDGYLVVADNIDSLYVIDPVAKTIVFSDTLIGRKIPTLNLARPIVTDNNTVVIANALSGYVFVLPDSLKSLSVVSIGYGVGGTPIYMGNNKLLLATYDLSMQPITTPNIILDVNGRITQSEANSLFGFSLVYGNYFAPNPSTSVYAYYPSSDVYNMKSLSATAGLSSTLGQSGLVYTKQFTGTYISPVVTSDNDLFLADGNKLVAMAQEWDSVAWEPKRAIKWESQFDFDINQITLANDGTVYVSSKTGGIAAISDINNGVDHSKWMMQGHDAQMSYSASNNLVGGQIAISSPVDKTTVDPTLPVTLTATAQDANNLDVSSQIQWVSSIDGNLGVGASISVTLSRGIHGLSARLLDSNNISYLMDSIEVNVPIDNYPNLILMSPYQDAKFSGSGTVALKASASDIEDGDITMAIQWTSNIDGPIGSGGNVNASLTPGDHVITATITDSFGNTTSQQRPIFVSELGDEDMDKMDDLWEIATFGTLVRDGTGDYDNDGISDLEEYLLYKASLVVDASWIEDVNIAHLIQSEGQHPGALNNQGMTGMFQTTYVAAL